MASPARQAPTQIGGYAYADDNPVINADPTGQYATVGEGPCETASCVASHGGDGGQRGDGSSGDGSSTGAPSGPGGTLRTILQLILALPHPKPLIAAFEAELKNDGKVIPDYMAYRDLPASWQRHSIRGSTMITGGILMTR